jgi:hypothetical protein
MGNIAIHKANDLPSDARQVVERVLGRVLEPDEEVSIMAISPQDAPSGEARQQLARQLEERITRTAESVRHIPDHEQEAAIDEAVSHVRANPQ